MDAHNESDLNSSLEPFLLVGKLTLEGAITLEALGFDCSSSTVNLG